MDSQAEYEFSSHQLKTWILLCKSSKLETLQTMGVQPQKKNNIWLIPRPLKHPTASVLVTGRSGSNNNQGCSTHPKMTFCKIRFASFHPKLVYHLHSYSELHKKRMEKLIHFLGFPKDHRSQLVEVGVTISIECESCTAKARFQRATTGAFPQTSAAQKEVEVPSHLYLLTPNKPFDKTPDARGPHASHGTLMA